MNTHTQANRAQSSQRELINDILQLKKSHNALILAHYYQRPEVQDVADMVGDSLQMARFAATSNADILLVAGVYFMAETAKILNPQRKVLLPDLNAGCSLADSCPPRLFKEFIDRHPGATVVTYINCSSEVKAMSDLVCTSSNAVRIIQSLPHDQPIIFAPDINLGRYLIHQTGRPLILWDGHCLVHESFSIDRILTLHKQYPEARFIAHPESPPHVLKVASYIGSTQGMIDFVKTDAAPAFIVATEAGILHRMQQVVPDKTLIPAPTHDDNTCACSECAFMKLNTLEKIHQCLLKESPEIEVEETTRLKAARAVQRMLAIS